MKTIEILIDELQLILNKIINNEPSLDNLYANFKKKEQDIKDFLYVEKTKESDK